MSEPIRAPLRRQLAARIQAGEVMLVRDDGSILLTATANPSAAVRACGMARRVLGVTFRPSDLGWRAEVEAVWHRLPHVVPVPISVAAALAANGAPACVIESEQP